MKKFNSLAILLILVLALSLFVACDQTDAPFGDNPFMNPGDMLGGGGVGVNNSQDTDTTAQEEDIEGASSVDESALRENLNPDGATLLIGSEITVAGDYVLTGNYENGVTIDVENGETTHIYLSGATVSNDNGVAILNSNKKSTLIITLVEGTTNIVSNACDDENAIHVKGDAIFNGKGKLVVNSTTKNGIKVSKSLVMVDGVYELSAANHGITAKSIHIVDSNINVLSAGKDGIQAECVSESCFMKDVREVEPHSIAVSVWGFIFWNSEITPVILIGMALIVLSLYSPAEATASAVIPAACMAVTKNSSLEMDSCGLK